MTKLEKLKKDFEKAETTLQNAKKRRKLLAERVQVEEQKELQTLMANSGVTAAEIRELLTGDKVAPSFPPTAEETQEVQGGRNFENEQ